MRTFGILCLCAALGISGAILLHGRFGHEAPLQVFYGRTR